MLLLAQSVQHELKPSILKKTDPQIYALLNGEILSPPPEVDESLIEAAIVEATQLEQQYASQESGVINSSPIDNTSFDGRAILDTSLVNRKWDKMNPRYKQRLLMVFKIMKEQYGYELVLLEGYRSPARQNMLAGNPNTTRAKGYQSYHQFGLAADVAFKRNGKLLFLNVTHGLCRVTAYMGKLLSLSGLHGVVAGNLYKIMAIQNIECQA